MGGVGVCVKMAGHEKEMKGDKEGRIKGGRGHRKKGERQRRKKKGRKKWGRGGMRKKERRETRNEGREKSTQPPSSRQPVRISVPSGASSAGFSRQYLATSHT